MSRQPRRGEGVLDSRQRAAAVAGLERLDAELMRIADYLDAVDEPRAASMILSASRSVLAAAHLIAPSRAATAAQGPLLQAQCALSGHQGRPWATATFGYPSTERVSRPKRYRGHAAWASAVVSVRVPGRAGEPLGAPAGELPDRCFLGAADL